MSYKYLNDCDKIHWTKQKAGPLRFENRWLEIDGQKIIVRKGYAWDGCTCAPDFYAQTKGSLFHDAIYQFAEDIAAEWGWSVRDVLKFGDKVFLEVMRQWNSDFNPLPWIYYGAVRGLGYPFHQLMRFIHK